MSLDSLEVARAQYLWTLHRHKPALDDQIKDLAKVFGVLMRAETLRKQAQPEPRDGAASNGHLPAGAFDLGAPPAATPAALRPPSLLTLPVHVATSNRRDGRFDIVGVCPHPEAANGPPLPPPATRPVGTETLRVQRACRLGLVRRALMGMRQWLRR